MIRILTIAIFITIILGSFIKDQQISYCMECNDVEYRRPDVFVITGKGSLNVEPTIATIEFEIEIKDELAEKALDTANQIQSKAFKSLQSIDTTNVKITTTQFEMYPHTEYDGEYGNGQLIFQGYKVIISQELKTTNLKIVGKLIDVAINAGVTTIIDISYDIQPEIKSVLKDQIIQQAINDATDRAEVALKAVNMKIHSIKNIDKKPERRYQDDLKWFTGNGLNSKATSLQIFAQELNLSHSVKLGFIIVPINQ